MELYTNKSICSVITDQNIENVNTKAFYMFYFLIDDFKHDFQKQGN